MKNMTILVKHKCIHIIRHYGKNSFKVNFKKNNKYEISIVSE